MKLSTSLLAATLSVVLVVPAPSTLHAAPPDAGPDAGPDTAPDAGPLDLPAPHGTTRGGGRGGARVAPEVLGPARGVRDRASLEREVRREQRRLGRLGRGALERAAHAGERGAQAALGESYAREAGSLAFYPAAANDALADAVRWYSLAASRGFPGAPSLDRAGIDPYPIRAQRPRRR